MENYKGPTIKQTGWSSAEVTYLYNETTVWNVNYSTVDTKYLVFSFVALAVYAVEAAVLLLSPPPQEG